jgi:hypothetical protein
MNEHYFVTADQGHLRIFRERMEPGQRDIALDPVESMDFPAGVKSYSSRDTAMAGRFQSSKNQVGAPGGGGRAGMSIDERMPMHREEDRRRARDVATEIEAFFGARPGATFDFAGAPESYKSVVGLLSPQLRRRLRRTIAKDLVNQRTEDLRAHVAALA